MRKRVRIALVVLLVALGGVIAWQALRPQEREPVYEGKPLTYWIDRANGTSPPENRKAEQVVHKAGTNAIPTLLRLLRRRDSALVLKLILLARKQHVVKVGYMDHLHRTFVATRAFVALGADAQDAIAELIRIFDQNISEVSQADIAEIFGSIGPPARDAIPSLLRAAANTNRIVHECAIEGLSGIHAEPESVVPVLTKCLSDPDWSVKRFALSGLQAFGKDAKPAVPALVEFFRAQEVGSDKSLAGNALKAIDPEAAAKEGLRVPVLAESLSDTNSWIRFHAASGLGGFGAEARDAVPALVRLLGDPEEIVRYAATNALKAIDPDAPAKAGVK